MHNVSAMIRKRYLHVAADDSRRTDIQELTCNHEAIAFRLRFNLDINLVGVSAIEHLSSSQTARTRTRQHRLQETVEQHFDQAAHFLPLLGAASRSECRFGDSLVRRGRLIALLDCRRVVNLLPCSKGLRASPATCTQVFLHRFLLLWRTHLVHEINPFIIYKVLHFHSPISLSPSFRSPADTSQVRLLGIKGTRGKERYREGAF